MRFRRSGSPSSGQLDNEIASILKNPNANKKRERPSVPEPMPRVLGRRGANDGAPSLKTPRRTVTKLCLSEVRSSAPATFQTAIYAT